MLLACLNIDHNYQKDNENYEIIHKKPTERIMLKIMNSVSRVDRKELKTIGSQMSHPG